MARITSHYPTIESVEIDDIEQGMRRAHRLRSQAFTTFFSNIVRGLFRRASDKAAEPIAHRGCASAAS
ncbi:MAG: RSP_7527 family protein [Geminicoccaceae bacterium]